MGIDTRKYQESQTNRLVRDDGRPRPTINDSQSKHCYGAALSRQPKSPLRPFKNKKRNQFNNERNCSSPIGTMRKPNWVEILGGESRQFRCRILRRTAGAKTRFFSGTYAGLLLGASWQAMSCIWVHRGIFAMTCLNDKRMIRVYRLHILCLVVMPSCFRITCRLSYVALSCWFAIGRLFSFFLLRGYFETLEFNSFR